MFFQEMTGGSGDIGDPPKMESFTFRSNNPFGYILPNTPLTNCELKDIYLI
jgi:hypothetical protein